MSCDRISELPDCLLTHLLSYLPTKDCITTSILSKRWEFLWLKVSGLDLNIPYREGNIALVGFMDKFLEFNRGSCLKKFKINYTPFTKGQECYPMVKWIGEVVHRGVEHLDVENEEEPHCLMPKSVFVSKTLVSLKLVKASLGDPNFVVSLPCLKIMHLENNIYYKSCYYSMVFTIGDGLLVMEKLISGSPVLENITLDLPKYGRRKQVSSFWSNVPQCLSSTLEYVKINKLIMHRETGIKLVNYFLENSAVLKKLILETDRYKKLLTSTKLSPKCQICVSYSYEK